jgi:hypothetical protein
VVPGAFVALVLLAGQVGARQASWFGLTDDMLDLDGQPLSALSAVGTSAEARSVARRRPQLVRGGWFPLLPAVTA